MGHHQPYPCSEGATVARSQGHAPAHEEGSPSTVSHKVCMGVTKRGSWPGTIEGMFWSALSSMNISTPEYFLLKRWVNPLGALAPASTSILQTSVTMLRKPRCLHSRLPSHSKLLRIQLHLLISSVIQTMWVKAIRKAQIKQQQGLMLFLAWPGLDIYSIPHVT